jgi:hypothetical protein
MPARGGEALAGHAHTIEHFGGLVEHDERRRARRRITDMRVSEHVFWPEVPYVREFPAYEERRRQRQAAAERLSDADHVRDILTRPHLADATEPGVDCVDNEQRIRFVAAPPQRIEPTARRNARTGPALHGFNDHAGCVSRKRAGIVAVGEAVNGTWKPGRKRLAETLEAGRREREQSSAVVRTLERDDSRPPRVK